MTPPKATSTGRRTSSTSSRNTRASGWRWRASLPMRARMSSRRASAARASSIDFCERSPLIGSASARSSCCAASGRPTPCESISAPGCEISSASAATCRSKRRESSASEAASTAASPSPAVASIARSTRSAAVVSTQASYSVQKRSKRRSVWSKRVLLSCSRFSSRSQVNQAR